ncbi:MAG: hypothetical protein EXR47_01180 [Dehalococcoidia bacterium]|nr:hypothetical protein [Dehalococcoidia bacterium]
MTQTASWKSATLGDAIGPVERNVTTAAVITFCETWGQGRPGRFTSDEVARKEGLSGAIVPGIMSMALLSKLLTDWAPNVTVSKLDVIFRQPVPHNQPLKLHGLITDEREVEGRRELTADVFLDMASGNRLVTGQAVLLLAKG